MKYEPDLKFKDDINRIKEILAEIEKDVGGKKFNCILAVMVEGDDEKDDAFIDGFFYNDFRKLLKLISSAVEKDHRKKSFPVN